MLLLHQRPRKTLNYTLNPIIILLVPNKCGPGQKPQGNPPRCIPASSFQRVPGLQSIGSKFSSAPAATPSGGFSPFSNSAGSGRSPASTPGEDNSFFFSLSNVPLDSSNFETITLDLPFARVRAPITQVIQFSLSTNYRDNSGGLGVQVLDQANGFGYEFQCSVGPSPDRLFVLIYSQWGALIDPGQVEVMRHDYEVPWPAGLSFTITVTIDSNMIPHLYIDGIEAPLTDNGESLTQVQRGETAILYGYSSVPGNTANVEQLTIQSGVVPP